MYMKVLMIAEAIHDAHMENRKFARDDGQTIDRILQGRAKQGLSDDDDSSVTWIW